MKNYFYFLLFILYCSIITSCNNQKTGLTGEEFEKVIVQAQEKIGNNYSSLHYLDSIYHQYPDGALDFKFKYLTYACGFYHVNMQNDDSASIYADSMLALVNNRHDKEIFLEEEAYANMSKGDILFAKKNYSEAYQYYFLGKVAAEKSLDPCIYSEYCYRIAMVLYKQADYLNAADYFKLCFNKSLSCEVDFGHFVRQQEVLNNTALSYFKGNVIDSAAHYYDKALDFINSNEKKFPNKSFFNVARGVIYGNIAQTYAASDFDKAEKLYIQSIAINSQPGNEITDALVTQVHLADLYITNQKWEKGFQVLKAINNGFDSIKNEQAEMDWNRLMWKYCDYNKEYTKAYTHLNNYENLKSKGSDVSKDLRVVNMANKMEELQSKYEIELLEKDKKLNGVYILILIGSLAVFIALVFMIWYNWKKSAKNYKLLQQLNTQIVSQKDELQKALDKLELEHTQKDQILRTVAHDIRTPISGINGAAAILNDMDEMTDEQKTFLKIIETASSDALEMISDILEVTGNPGSKSVNRECVNVSEIVYHCVQLLQFKAQEKNQYINFQRTGNNLKVIGNEENLRRVINNIITNAIKFSPVDSNINITVSDRIECGVISVQDYGIGIPAEMNETLFDVFTKAKRRGTNNEKPFGLGLSICKQIIEDHKGKIWFESEVNKGTTFHIELPKTVNS